jgi:hypothetical protein
MSPIEALIDNIDEQMSGIVHRVLSRGVEPDTYLKLQTQHQTLAAVREQAVQLRDHRRVDEDEVGE